MRFEHRIDVTCGSSGIVGQRHRGTAEDVDIGNDAASSQSITEVAESLLDRSTVEERSSVAHATSSSWAETNTPLRRKAAGAWTMASARAAGVLKGNQNRRRRRGSLQEGAPRPSRAARCSASAASRTSHRSSPVSGGSSTSSSDRLSVGSHRYSSRNSAMSRHHSRRWAIGSRRANSASVIAWYCWTPSACSMTTLPSRKSLLGADRNRTCDPPSRWRPTSGGKVGGRGLPLMHPRRRS
jgi:hypothetical protein